MGAQGTLVRVQWFLAAVAECGQQAFFAGLKKIQLIGFGNKNFKTQTKTLKRFLANA